MGRHVAFAVPRRYPAVVTDRHGRVETVLIHDGWNFRLPLRGNVFESAFITGLVLNGPLADSAEPPELLDVRLTGDPGDPGVPARLLCGYTLEWIMSLMVRVGGAEPGPVPLRVLMVVPPGTSDAGGGEAALTASVDLPERGGVYAGEQGPRLEEALLSLASRLPPAVRIVGCLTCVFAHYNPYGGDGLGCFRGVEGDGRGGLGKRELYAIWARRTEDVQETYWCGEFEPRRSATA
ncbi:DUF6304 family protein [Yinghuangia sp. YIM S09857]|uniref:DUF6304 family protein n=1 Tax=Yinghuangia sp. YIM S09857 TaxID=3436929 RepID=UPI003F5380DF